MRRAAVLCPDSSSSVAWRTAFVSEAPRRSPAASSSRWRSRHARRRALPASSIRSGRQPDGEPFEHGAGLEDLDRLLVGDRPHAGSAVRLAHDEPFLLEPDERSSHRAARHLELR